MEDCRLREISSDDGTEPSAVVHVCSPLLWRLGQKEFEFKSILGYIETSKEKEEGVGTGLRAWITERGFAAFLFYRFGFLKR